MNTWIFGTIGVGAVVLILALVFFVKDSQAMLQWQKKGNYLLPNLSLTILSFVWIGLAVYLYLDVQNQINFFLK
ncbi:hypothetical protein [Enterococcus sp. AZ072]|uniref:hypothetical protein n=1 Tax=unclassified Enterococcus TaxID=2608891 RepID=UPI003D2E4B68